jgi:hypothetical protein
MKRRALVTATLTPVGVLGVAGVAFAFWTVASSGAAGSAAADSLGVPTVSTSDVTASHVTINVTAAPTSGPAPTAYRVDRTGPGTAVAGVCSITGSTGSCVDPSPSAGSVNHYSVFGEIGASWVASTAATTTADVPSSDIVAPETTTSVSQAANTAGWNNADVTVTLSATDAGSGVASITYSTSGSQVLGNTTVNASSVPVVINTAGTTTIAYHATDNANNIESTKTLVIKLDKTGPANAISLTGVTGGALLSGTKVYYLGSSAGQFSFRNALTDGLSGPASSSTLALSGPSTGWTHTPSTVTTTTGGAYVSNPYAWASSTTSNPQTAVVGADVADNQTPFAVQLENDVTGPSGGSVSVSPVGFTKNTTATVTFNRGADTQSGINTATAVIQRASAVDNHDGTCGTFGAYSTLATAPAGTSFNDTGLINGCYAYQYVVSDNLGNTTTYGPTSAVIVDTTAPSVTINQAAGQADPTNNGTINFTATFSEAVTGFTSSDITVGGTASGTKTVTLTGTGPTYNVAVSGATGNGTVTAAIGANTVQDTAGNSNTASTSTDNSVTLDTTVPTVTINQAAGQADPTNNGTINFTATFSEAVTGFTSSDITVGGTASGTKTVTLTGTGPTYNVAVSGATGNGTVTAAIGANTVQDTAGNDNTASTSTDNSVTLDTTVPTVTINQAAGQADPTKTLPINWTVQFSEPVTGFDNTDLVRAGTGTGGTLSITGSGSTYNVALTGTPSNGSTSFSMLANRVSDAAGNGNTASTSTDATVTYDTVGPTITSINRTAGATNPTNTGPLSWTVTFSEPVSGVSASNFTLATSGTGGTAPTIASVTPTGTAPVATWTVVSNATGTTGTNTGSIGLNLANGTAIVDSATNPTTSTTLTGQAFGYDTLPPVVSITSMSSGGGSSKITVAGSGGRLTGDQGVTVYVCVNNPCTAALATESMLVTPAANGSWSVTSGNNGGGAWYAMAQQVDSAGNVATTSTFGPFTR